MFLLRIVPNPGVGGFGRELILIFFATLGRCECQFLCGDKGAGYVVIMESDSDKDHNIICDPISIAAFLFNYVSFRRESWC